VDPDVAIARLMFARYAGGISERVAARNEGIGSQVGRCGSKRMVTPWIKAIWLPALLAAALPYGAPLIHAAAGESAVDPSRTSILWWCLGLIGLVAWAGWRVVMRGAGTLRAAALGGAVTMVACLVPGLLRSTWQPVWNQTPEVEGPGWWGYALGLSVWFVAGMVGGWLGGGVGALVKRSHAT